MNLPVRFRLADLAATPWKNGGGTTREIASWPPGAGLDRFGWRLSVATIAAAGPFSAFPGIDRCIMLLEGDGVRLRSRDGRIDHRLDRPHAPFAFAGEAEIDCTLQGGVSTDFNVMTRRGQWRAELRVIEEAQAVEAAPHGLLLALAGDWRIEDGTGAGVGGAGAMHPPLSEGEGLCWQDAAHAWRAAPAAPGAPARLAVVRFLPC